MHSQLSVEVIIPVFNDINGLKECLAALARQRFDKSRLKVTIVDNGSSPPLALPEVSGLTATMVSCDVPGSYAARNFGARLATSDVLVFLDADCVPEEGWLTAGLSTLNQYPNEGIAGGEVRYILDQNPSATEVYQAITGFGQRDNILIRRFSATANLFVRYSVFERVGEFNQDLLSGGDREWCWRAERLGFSVVFSEGAIVKTAPRKSLRGAIVQARRVAGGRLALESIVKATDVVSTYIRPEKKILGKMGVILSSPDCSKAMKLRVLFVATIIMMARKFETIRLIFGGRAERR